MQRRDIVGHERIGFLPKTKQWNAIVQQLSEYEGSDEAVTKIANDTLSCIRKTYEQMPYDESVNKAIKFLALLSYSAKKTDQVSFLNENGCSVDNKLSLFSLMNSAKNYIETERDSLEINKIARDAVLQAITTYQGNHISEQLSLFSSQSDSVWKDAGSGAAFCELARLFFAAFTDRQIKYYIERSAASEIDDYAVLRSFSYRVSQQADAISHHAFDTSKIMQSFAAGWFNKNAVNSIPSDRKVTDFLRYSFGKMREEFRREAEEQ